MSSVSILCALHDHAAFVHEALASALAQTRPAVDVTVIDDGSRDTSAAVAESIPGVRVIRAPHRGVAATRNALLEHGAGDLVAWLDSDDIWTPDKLAVQIAFMESHPEVGVTFTHQRLRLEPGALQPHWVSDAMLEAASPALGTCSMVARRALFQTVGGFDPSLDRDEDTDWLLRATAAGVRHLTLPEVLLVRRVHDRNLTHDTLPWADRVFGILRKHMLRGRAARRPSDPGPQPEVQPSDRKQT